MAEPVDHGTGSQVFLAYGPEGGFPNTVCQEHNAKWPLVTDGDALIWRLHADTWEEAMTLYHELQGWEPYNPME